LPPHIRQSQAKHGRNDDQNYLSMEMSGGAKQNQISVEDPSTAMTNLNHVLDNHIANNRQRKGKTNIMDGLPHLPAVTGANAQNPSTFKYSNQNLNKFKVMNGDATLNFDS